MALLRSTMHVPGVVLSSASPSCWIVAPMFCHWTPKIDSPYTFLLLLSATMMCPPLQLPTNSSSSSMGFVARYQRCTLTLVRCRILPLQLDSNVHTALLGLRLDLHSVAHPEDVPLECHLPPQGKVAQLSLCFPFSHTPS